MSGPGEVDADIVTVVGFLCFWVFFHPSFAKLKFRAERFPGFLDIDAVT